MNKRQIAIAVIGMVGVLVASDFVANIRTFASPTILAEIAEELGGISLEQQLLRVGILSVLTFAAAALCLGAAWGFYRNLVLKTIYPWAAAALLLNAIFHFLTAITLPASMYVWYMSAAYVIVATLVFTVGRWTSS